MWPFKRSDSRSSLIDGIQNDTLLLIFLVAALIGLWIYYTRRRRSTTIHPDNRSDVELLRQRSEDHGDSTRRTTSSASQDTCPICLTEPPVLTVETNCGHKFCGKCIISYWKFQANWMSGLKCPVCRQQITVLLTRFTTEEQRRVSNADRKLIVDGVKDFNRRFSGAPRTWTEYFYDIPVLIPHLVRQIFSLEGLTWTYRLRTIIIFLSTIVYVISPLDILPESLVGIFGLLDDFLILVGAGLYFVASYRQNLAAQ